MVLGRPTVRDQLVAQKGRVVDGRSLRPWFWLWLWSRHDCGARLSRCVLSLRCADGGALAASRCIMSSRCAVRGTFASSRAPGRQAEVGPHQGAKLRPVSLSTRATLPWGGSSGPLTCCLVPPLIHEQFEPAKVGHGLDVDGATSARSAAGGQLLPEGFEGEFAVRHDTLQRHVPLRHRLLATRCPPWWGESSVLSLVCARAYMYPELVLAVTSHAHPCSQPDVLGWVGQSGM